ncbi:MAG: hypothetical protein ACR2QQ_12815 [Gammaproteobacteria bacterium]
MNTNEPDEVLPGSDQTSEAYRAAGFDEAPPAALDRAILAEAARSNRRSLFSFMPPLALAATVVLSVSLVMRSGVLNENTEVFSDGPISDMPAGTSPAPMTIEQDAGGPPAESLDRLEAEATGLSSSAVADDSAATSPEAPTPAQAPAEQTQPVAERAQAPAAPQEAVFNARSLESTLEEVVVTTPFDCADVDTAIADDWLACIATGVEQGQIDAARQELEAFLVVYPEYSLPEELEILQ